MQNFNKWFAESKIASYLRALFAILVAQAVADFVKSGSLDFSNAEAWLIAALAATLPMLLRILNPADSLN